MQRPAEFTDSFGGLNREVRTVPTRHEYDRNFWKQSRDLVQNRDRIFVSQPEIHNYSGERIPSFEMRNCRMHIICDNNLKWGWCHEPCHQFTKIRVVIDQKNAFI